jgi:hypothetical protein
MSAATDTLGDQIVAAGLAANSFLLDINGALHVPQGFPFLPRGICLRACSGGRSKSSRPRRASRVKLV